MVLSEQISVGATCTIVEKRGYSCIPVTRITSISSQWKRACSQPTKAEQRTYTYIRDDQTCMCLTIKGAHMPVWPIDIFGHLYLEGFTYKDRTNQEDYISKKDIVVWPIRKEIKDDLLMEFMREDKGSFQKSKGSTWLVVKQASVHTDRLIRR